MIARTSIPLRFLGLALSLVTLGAFVVPARLASPPVAAGLLSGLVWRNLGPFRGGRIAALSGAIRQPGVLFVGLPFGRRWETNSAGGNSRPISDTVSAATSVPAP